MYDLNSFNSMDFYVQDFFLWGWTNSVLGGEENYITAMSGKTIFLKRWVSV